jgi:hypothetical protein
VTMDDNKFLLITFVCAILVFSMGYLAGSFNPHRPSCDSSCNFLRETLLNRTDNVSLPVNCSNPFYNDSDNAWYCEVD